MIDNNEDILIGEVVEHKMNTNVFGVVIGFMGSLVIIRTSPELTNLAFHEWELRHMDDDGAPIRDEKASDGSNIIAVDFTKRVRLDKNTNTKGAA